MPGALLTLCNCNILIPSACENWNKAKLKTTEIQFFKKVLEFGLKNLKVEDLIISFCQLLRYPVTLVITNKHLLSSLDLLISASDQRVPLEFWVLSGILKVPLMAMSRRLSQIEEPRAALPGAGEPPTSPPCLPQLFFPPKRPISRKVREVLGTDTALFLGHPRDVP